jgi:hypothetical protein
MKPTTFENIRNHEKLICDDVRKGQFLDGVLYLPVHRAGEHRVFLMRKDALAKVAEKK